MSDATAPEVDCCLVVSHYNAWETDQLIALLDQTLTIPAGVPFHTRVVVNQARPIPLELPERFAHVEVFYRPNTGYNIGAWDHGWRVGRPYGFYLFLQEECIILRRNWMAKFLALASKPGVGLVGEAMVYQVSWARLKGLSKGWRRLFDYHQEGATPSAWYDQLGEAARARGVDLGDGAGHLQSLIFAVRREVLERTDGFESTATEYRRAVISELLSSKAVSTLGLRVRQAGLLPFAIISHPQWKRSLPATIWEVGVVPRIPPKLRRLSFLAYHWAKSRVARTTTTG